MPEPQDKLIPDTVTHLQPEQRKTLAVLLERNTPSLPDVERAKLVEQVETLAEHVAGAAYRLGWNEGRLGAWIPTTERYPKPGVPCALFIPGWDYDEEDTVRYGWLLSLSRGWEISGRDGTMPCEEVTHWQPMPTAPRSALKEKATA